ncbi:UvrD-helicase domain-containing protein [Acholeplasma laidlawii]|uniref:UvrD-helicase domain-containing protein n=1 Tax=Acholeplasma laidlawii TaxID=2148 RepID=UPI0021F6ED5B|nr:UvrD-helicase domain-containing protein [Acholeplasma laidlawii]
MDKLIKQQLKAVNSLTGNTIVLAGAGTGKTRVLINRNINLIEHEADLSEILAFTFTNKAANKMKYRIGQYHKIAEQIHISTFHSFCYSYLYDFSEYVGYPNRFNIIDDDDRIKTIKEIIKNNNLEILDKDALKIISNIKNHTSTEYETINQMVLMNFIFHEYQIN